MKYNKFETGQNFYLYRDKVTSQQPYSTDKHFYTDKHYHNLFEIYYITSGNCIYFIDNKAYDLIPGDVILIPEGVIHNTEYRTLEHTRLLINCSQRFIPTSVRPLLGQMIYLYRNPAIADEIENLFLKIEEEYKKTDSLHEEILRCYTHMLFFLLARNLQTKAEIYTAHDYIDRSIDYLQKNFASNISLSEIASMYSVTPVHFSRMFKKTTGFGFCEYLNILRLQKAESLLNQFPDSTITEISLQCGFSDSNYFSVKFKEMYGMSPKAFSKRKAKK